MNPSPENQSNQGQDASQLSPELKAWALHAYSEEEIVANFHEISETGGVELDDFIQDLERAADGGE